MEGIISKTLGSAGIAEIAGDQVGKLVKEGVEKVMDGGGNKGEEEKGGGFDVGNILSAVGGNKDDNKGGFDVGNVLSAVGGDKKEGDGGGLGNVLGLFK